ncbi:MAG: FtsB family cell division protein [Terriglobales bacterium]
MLTRRQRRKLKYNLGRGLRLALIAVPVLWLAQHAVLGPNGWLALRRERQTYRQETARIHSLEAQNRKLNDAVAALRTSPGAIEDIAREQLHLTKPGEVVYTYPVAPTAQSAGAAAAALHR